MYRKDVLRLEGHHHAGRTRPGTQVADIAAKVDGAQPGMAGICLRGQPGWGQVFAPLTTVVNTFGGTWFTRTGRRGRRAGVRRRDELLRRPGPAHGEKGAPQAGFTECLNNLVQGNVAMWYDATSAAGSLEAADSPVKGKIGYVAAPVVKHEELRLAVLVGLGHPDGQHKEGQRLEVHLLGVGKEYEELVGQKLGWSKRPGRQARLDLREPRLPQGRLGVRDADQVRRSSPPTRTTRACSHGRRSASSSSTSPSSPTSGPRSRRTSARRSPVG